MRVPCVKFAQFFSHAAQSHLTAISCICFSFIATHIENFPPEKMWVTSTRSCPCFISRLTVCSHCVVTYETRRQFLKLASNFFRNFCSISLHDSNIHEYCKNRSVVIVGLPVSASCFGRQCISEVLRLSPQSSSVRPSLFTHYTFISSRLFKNLWTRSFPLPPIDICRFNLQTIVLRP